MKLRSFKDVEEFLRVTKIALGNAVRYRRKNSDHECVVIFDGYYTNDKLVNLGGIYYKLTDLFEYFEYYDNDNSKWKPFGVEE